MRRRPPRTNAGPAGRLQRRPLDQVRFDLPLVHTARVLASGKPLKIVALGSSSTYGAGASTSAASYPSRLADELGRRFPGHEITVLNRGVNGDEAADMLARLDTAVIAEKPDLVLWQVGTNSVLRDKPLLPHAPLLHEGLARLKATGADVVLIDPQYAPRVIAKPTCRGHGVAHRHHGEGRACRRLSPLRVDAALAREPSSLPFETFVSTDGLHMNDWSYACLAKALGVAIAEAATRPTATAVGPHPAPAN